MVAILRPLQSSIFALLLMGTANASISTLSRLLDGRRGDVSQEVVGGHNRILKTKSGSGKKGDDSGKKGGEGGSCQMVEYTILESDLEDSYFFNISTNSDGFVGLPLFSNADATEQIGVYNSLTVYIPGWNDDQNCIAKGSLSFADEYGSQIFNMYTCEGDTEAVVGGTGAFSCASGGFADEVIVEGVSYTGLLEICGAPCPIDY